MELNTPDPVQNLDSVYRLTTEANPIKVRPYMITERDLAEIGHASCSFCPRLVGTSREPRWFVSGWASCDRHLADVIRSAAEFNHRHQTWSTTSLDSIEP